MRSTRLSVFTAACLVLGGLLGMAGSFAPVTWRGVAWGLDGTALVIGTALLAVHHVRRGDDWLAAAFVVFVAGQTLVTAGSAMTLAASAPTFAAGAGLWAAALAMIATSSSMPVLLRGIAGVAAVLFAITALQVYAGSALTPLSRPLPFDAYPALVLTLFGLAWSHVRAASRAGV